MHTKGYKHQYQFDKILSDLDISSLKFLNYRYNREIRDFRNQFDLGDVTNQKGYQEMIQRKKMIQEEIGNRINDIYSSPSLQDRGSYVDYESGLVFDENSLVEYTVAYNSDEPTEIIYIKGDWDTCDNDVSSNCDDDFELEEPKTRKELYEGWKYW